MILQVFAQANFDCRKLVLRIGDAKSSFRCVVGSGKFLFDRRQGWLECACCRLLQLRSGGTSSPL
jgi:hypothetical protein